MPHQNQLLMGVATSDEIKPPAREGVVPGLEPKAVGAVRPVQP